MEQVASRELRNHTADVLRRVRDGSVLGVTVHGDVVAELHPPGDRRPRFLTKAELTAALTSGQADAGLREALAVLAGDTTDELRPVE